MPSTSMHRFVTASWSMLITFLAPATTTAVYSAEYVEFDFSRAIECRDVTPPERLQQYPYHRLVELKLPVSVRFRGVEPNDVEELTVEISGASAGLYVYQFAPTTQLASDVAQPIETVTTSKSGRSLDATLGGALPVPFAAKVANVTPSISAGTSSGETTTEKLNRLPPKHPLVVSGTSLQGRGVFFKLKKSSQTSLEGVHVFSVVFIAPAEWRGGDIGIACSALGKRTVLWLTQSAILGSESDGVRLCLVGPSTRQVARPIFSDTASPVHRASYLESSASQLKQSVDDTTSDTMSNEPKTVTAAKTTESEPSPPRAEQDEAVDPRE